MSKEITIAINMGHTLSGKGTGAVGLVKETDKNREVGNKLITKLQDYNCKVLNCTIDKSNNDMYEACNKANVNNADVFISIHLNAGGGTGVETFYSRYSNSRNIEFAKKVNSDLAATSVLSPSRRCCSDYSFHGYDLYVLKNTKMDAILVELGFVDNKKDVDRWNGELIANTMLNSIVSFYNLSKKQNTTVTSKPQTTPTPQNNAVNYIVKVTADVLNVRAGAGAEHKITTIVKKGQAYTIVEEKNGWGKLKSGAGWISLQYTTKNTTTTSKPVVKQEPKVIREYKEDGTASPLIKLDVKNSPDINSPTQTFYVKGESFKYNYVIIKEDYTWVRYTSYSGIYRYVIVKNNKTGERYCNCY